MKKNRLYIAVFFSLTLWASSFPGIKASLDGYSPFGLAAFRFLIASSTLAGTAPWLQVRWPRKQDLRLILVLAFVGVACYHVTLNYGELNATASAAAFIANIAPVFTGMIAWLFLGEDMHWRGWVGVGVSLLGVWFVATSQGGTFAIGVGALVLMVAALCWSLFFILQKPLLTYYTPLEVTCYAVWLGTVFLSPLLPQALAEMRGPRGRRRSQRFISACFPPRWRTCHGRTCWRICRPLERRCIHTWSHFFPRPSRFSG